jgi:hypothetical protein
VVDLQMEGLGERDKETDLVLVMEVLDVSERSTERVRVKDGEGDLECTLCDAVLLACVRVKEAEMVFRTLGDLDKEKESEGEGLLLPGFEREVDTEEVKETLPQAESVAPLYHAEDESVAVESIDALRESEGENVNVTPPEALREDVGESVGDRFVEGEGLEVVVTEGEGDRDLSGERDLEVEAQEDCEFVKEGEDEVEGQAAGRVAVTLRVGLRVMLREREEEALWEGVRVRPKEALAGLDGDDTGCDADAVEEEPPPPPRSLKGEIDAVCVLPWEAESHREAVGEPMNVALGAIEVERWGVAERQPVALREAKLVG